MDSKERPRETCLPRFEMVAEGTAKKWNSTPRGQQLENRNASAKRGIPKVQLTRIRPQKNAVAEQWEPPDDAPFHPIPRWKGKSENASFL